MAIHLKDEDITRCLILIAKIILSDSDDRGASILQGSLNAFHGAQYSLENAMSYWEEKLDELRKEE